VLPDAFGGSDLEDFRDFDPPASHS